MEILSTDKTHVTIKLSLNEFQQLENVFTLFKNSFGPVWNFSVHWGAIYDAWKNK